MRIPGTSLELTRPRALADTPTATYDIVEVASNLERAYAATSRTLDGTAGRDGSGSFYYDDLTGGWDKNPELAGRLKYEVFREMRLTDPSVRSLEWLFTLPPRSAVWSHVPARNDPDGPNAAKLRADFADWQFGLGRHFGAGRLLQTHSALLAQELLYLSYGAQGGELIWSKDIETFYDLDGNPHDCRPLVRIAPRMASSIEKIELDPVTGDIAWVKQDLPGAKPIPRDKLTWLVNESEGSDLRGSSILRVVFGPWRIKKALMLAAAIGWDRWSSGIPVVRHPSGKRAEAQAMGRMIRNHEGGYITFEGPPPEQGGDWALEVLNATGAIADPTPLLRYYDGQIATAGVQQFSTLAVSEHGSRAAGETLAAPYYMSVRAITDYVREERMRRVLRRLWDENFGPRIPIPELKASKLSARGIGETAGILANLVAAGLTFTDRDTQNDLRDELDLRHLPELGEQIARLPAGVGIAAGLPDDQVVAREGDSITA